MPSQPRRLTVDGVVLAEHADAPARAAALRLRVTEVGDALVWTLALDEGEPFTVASRGAKARALFLALAGAHEAATVAAD